jgi:hypothetical protein
MSRRPDPDRIRQAREAAERNRLLSAGELPERVNALIARWTVIALDEGLDATTSAYWLRAAAWTDRERLQSGRRSG